MKRNTDPKRRKLRFAVICAILAVLTAVAACCVTIYVRLGMEIRHRTIVAEAGGAGWRVTEVRRVYTEPVEGRSSFSRIFEYDESGNVIRKRYRDDEGTDVILFECTYDGEGWSLHSTSYTEKGERFQEHSYTYDESGRLLSERSDLVHSDYSGPNTSNEYLSAWGWRPCSSGGSGSSANARSRSLSYW